MQNEDINPICLWGKMTTQRWFKNLFWEPRSHSQWVWTTIVTSAGNVLWFVSIFSLIVSCNKVPSSVRIPVDRNVEWRIGETNYYIRNVDYIVRYDRRVFLQIMASVDYVPDKSCRGLALQFARHAVTSNCVAQIRSIEVDDAPVIFAGADIFLVQDPRLVSNACVKACRYTISAAELGGVGSGLVVP